MSIMFFTTALAVILPAAVMVAIIVLALRANPDREKSSAFECGFDPKNSARIPFSMRFFLLAIIFVVFDIEIVLLMPLPLMTYSISSTLMVLMFLIILIIGLLHEWNEGSLDWTT